MCIPYNEPNAFEHFHPKPILPMIVDWPKHLEISMFLHTTSFSSRFFRPIPTESNKTFLLLSSPRDSMALTNGKD
jgi:hypothetical protein